MKYVKMTKTWFVKAEDEVEAVRLVAADPTTYLKSEAVTRTEYKRPQQEAGWGAALRSQLVGSISKR